MTLIDRRGTRRRPICRECRKLHARKDCPRTRKAVDPCRQAARELAEFLDWYQPMRRAEMRREMA